MLRLCNHVGAQVLYNIMYNPVRVVPWCTVWIIVLPLQYDIYRYHDKNSDKRWFATWYMVMFLFLLFSINAIIIEWRTVVAPPILTVTLKDPYAVQLPSSAAPAATDLNQRPTTTTDMSNSSRSSPDGGADNGRPTGSDTADTPNTTTTTPSIRRNNPLSRFLLHIKRHNPNTLPTDTVGLSSLSPSIVWAVRSTSPPLPRLFPRWRSVGVTTGYRFEKLMNAPSYFEGNLDVALESGVDLNVSPSYTVRGGPWSCVVRLGGNTTTTSRSRSSTTGFGATGTKSIGGGISGSWFGLARFTNHPYERTKE